MSSSKTIRVPLPPLTLIFFIDRLEIRGFSYKSCFPSPLSPPAFPPPSLPASPSAADLFSEEAGLPSSPAACRGFAATLKISSSLLPP